MVECFSIKPRQAGTGESGAGPWHSKELTLSLDQRFLLFVATHDKLKLIGH
jgi:hypothetical protein